MTPDDLQILLKESFAKWVLALQPKVTSADTEHVTVRMPLTPDLKRVGGIVSGQALAALADTTMVLAAIAHKDKFIPLATTNLDTQFLRPGKGTAILCRGEVVKAGRALVFAKAELIEENSGKTVATATGTFFVP